MTVTEESLATGSLRAGVGSFVDPATERAFQHDYFLRSIRPVRTAITLAIGLFSLFSVLDPFFAPNEAPILLTIRLGIVVPILSVLLAFTYSRHFERYFQPSQFFAVMVGGSALVAMGLLGNHELTDAQFIAMLLAILWTHSVSRLQFAWATAASLFISALYIGAELWLGRLSTVLLVNNVFFVAAANLIGLIASYSLEAGYRRDFQQRQLLDQRRNALQESMDKLHEAERRVSELEMRAPDSLENLPRWAEQVASEIRRTVEAAEVRIWRCSEGEPLALTDGESAPPTREEVRAVTEMTRDAAGNVLVPLTGLSGEYFGAIVITSPTAWGSAERRLVAGFARYLGGALEILEKRHELALVEARREGARRRLQEAGIGLMTLCPTCGRVFQERVERCDVDGSRLAPRSLPFRVQDRYQFVRLLGQGGMGQVFLARDERLQRDVAIKVLLGDTPLDSDAHAQLAHEARAVARIGHPGVVEVFDLGHLDDGSAFIVMEYLTGRALSEELARHGRGSPRQVAMLLRQVGEALAAAHRTGVVHRDIKPQNVFLTRHPDGFQARLLDFGVARVAGAAEQRSDSGGPFGTPAYMAPEQVAGEPGDERSDMYSLAAVAFEALVGKRLVRQKPSVAATLASVLNEAPPSVSSHLPGIPPDIDRMFCHALSRDPARRPCSVGEWVAELAERLDAVELPEPAGWPLPITHELSYRGSLQSSRAD